MSPDPAEESARPFVFQTGTVEDPPPPTAPDDVERPQVWRQGDADTGESIVVGALPAGGDTLGPPDGE